HHLAAWLARLRRLPRKRREIAAPHLFVQLGELAAERGLARTEAGGEVGEGPHDACAGLEQDERCRDALELGDAGAACCFPLPARTLQRKHGRWAARSA